jgi:hypothetical protein
MCLIGTLWNRINPVRSMLWVYAHTTSVQGKTEMKICVKLALTINTSGFRPNLLLFAVDALFGRHHGYGNEVCIPISVNP